MDWNPGGAIKIPIPFDRGSESWEECNNHSDWKLVTGEE